MCATTVKQAVEERVHEILVSFGVQPEDIRRSATFEDLDVDSLDLVELAQIVEEEYEVKVTSEDAAQLATLGEAIDLIVSRVP